MNSDLSRSNKLFFLICVVPLLFFVKTRLKSIFSKVSWIFTYYVPVTILWFYIVPFSLKTLFSFVITITLINYIYENGYIENDVQTIKKESEPTKRLSAQEVSFVDKNYIAIMSVRFLVQILLIITYYIVNPAGVDFLLGLSILLQVVYLVYNRIRNKINLFLILLLNQIRFLGPIYPFVQKHDLLLFSIIGLSIYPLAKFIEFTSRARFSLFNMQKIIGDIDSFRLKYYLFILVLYFSVYHFFNNIYIYNAIIITAYFCIYRLVGFIIYKKKSVNRPQVF